MKFEETPDYDFLINLLKNVINNNCSPDTPDYDWNNKLKSDTNYEISKIMENNNAQKKKPNTSMFLNNKSTNSLIAPDPNDDTTLLPNHNNDLNKMSIFHKEEDKLI